MTPGQTKRVAIVGAILLALWVVWHIAAALEARSDPPAACQLLGGTWSFWDGWHCD